MNFGMEAILIFLPVIICLSAVFSASETVLLGLTADDRWRLQRDRPSAAQVIEKLLANPRRLLLTVVLANITVNSLYFAIATAALASTELSAFARIAVGLGEVICLIVFGEVLPKMVGNSMRLKIAPILARPRDVPHCHSNSCCDRACCIRPAASPDLSSIARIGADFQRIA